MSDLIQYDPENRITYEEDCDSLYVWKAPCQGKLGTVLLYKGKEGQMVSLDTDEVGTIVGIEINGVTKIMKEFNLNKN